MKNIYFLFSLLLVSMSFAQVRKITSKGQMTGPAVVKIYAVWCGACKDVAPAYKQLSNDMEGVNFYEVDHDQAPNFSTVKIEYLPTFIFYDAAGNRVGTVVGPEINQVKQKAKSIARAQVAHVEPEQEVERVDVKMAQAAEPEGKADESEEGFLGSIGTFFGYVADTLTKLICGIVALVKGVFKRQ